MMQPLVLAVLLANATPCGTSAAPQDPAAKPANPAPKKLGTIFKDQVDGLVRALVPRIATEHGFDCVATAQVLTAMGHCHRYYTLADGPLTRPAVALLLKTRQRDGAWALDPGDDARARGIATGWVLEALAAMDPDELATEIAEARRWLERHAPGATPWQQQLTSVRERAMRENLTPIEVGGATAARVARGPIQTDRGALDHAANVAALLELVACQVVAREIDERGVRGPAVAFTPMQQRGIDYLLGLQRDGTFFVDTPGGPVPDPGISGLGLAALQTKPEALRTPAERAAIHDGLATLVAAQNEDGSFGRFNVNYTTCAVVKALHMADRADFAPVLARAQRYILGIQNAEDRGYARSDRDYGSIGYGGDERGDLSNLHMAVEALRDTGLEPGHEAFAKAIVFLQRTQNLRAVNDFEIRARDDVSGEWYRSTSGDDGGSAYYPGNSPAGYVTLPDGRKVPRSYGSMTYALLKTYTLAGVKPGDLRVRAAIDWVRANWTLDENPGADPSLPEKTRYQGLYYAYMVLAQALSVTGTDELEVTLAAKPAGATGDDAKATAKVDWRAELARKLASLQAADGSWLNEKNGRWYEDQRVLCTIYALLALHHATR